MNAVGLKKKSVKMSTTYFFSILLIYTSISTGKLRRLCAMEKGRATAATNQRTEIELLVHEQRNAILQLQKSNKSMGHVKKIRDYVDTSDDAVSLSNARGTAEKLNTRPLTSGIEAELEWLKQRRASLENAQDLKSSTILSVSR